MKKALSIILATIVLLSSFCCITAFAEEAPKTDILLEEVKKSEEVSVTFTPGESTLFGFLTMNATNMIAVKDDTIAYLCDTGFFQIKVVATSKGIYGFFPAFPYLYVKLDTLPIIGTDMLKILQDATNLTQVFIEYQKSYNETVEGKEYHVEEYNDREYVTSKFYYEEDTLKMLRVENSKMNTVQVTHFDNISFDVEDSFFDVPVFALDVTPLLKGLFSAIIGAVGTV